MRQNKFFCVLCVSIVFFLSGCHRKSQNDVYTVKAEEFTNTLTYKADVAPLVFENVVSPADGTVEKVYFTPGSFVKKNQLLLSIRSAKYLVDYQNAMVAFLKAKEDYVNAQTSFLGTQELWKNGLISRDEYQTQKTSLANSYALLLQQEQNARKFLSPNEKLDDKWSLQNKATLDNLFNKKESVVYIYAPTDGIALDAVKTNDTSSGSQDTPPWLTPGGDVHQNQSLLTVGDVSGFSFMLSVSEMDIDKIKPGMKAVISSDAFSEVLSGLVSDVGIQAKQTSGDAALPEFPVRVIVPKLPPSALQEIRMGMSAKVEVQLGNNERLLIPLRAVGEEKGQSVVRKFTKLHRTTITPVVTGDTTLDQVTVLSGLQKGDQILVPYPA